MGYDERVDQASAIRPFGGIETRYSDINTPDLNSPDLRNVNLHPIGTIKKRFGFTETTGPGLDTDEIKAMFTLNQPSVPKQWLYSCAEL